MKTLRCRVRASGVTTTVECLAPTAQAAAWVLASQGLQDDAAPWIQVAVSEWSDDLADYMAPDNVIIVSARDPAPPGTDKVVFYSVASDGASRPTSGGG